jgi:hypothetical protein
MSVERGCTITSAKEERIFMYIGYIDDSGSTGTNLDDPHAPFQVIGGPIIRDRAYSGIELTLSSLVERLVPEDQWDSFEFHAADLFYAREPFDKIGREKCRELMAQALAWIEKFKVPIIYGAVDKAKLRSQIYRTANPVDIAFELYLGSIWKWFDKIYRHEKESPTGILICDDAGKRKADDEGRRRDMRGIIERAFRRNRTKPRGASTSGISMFLFDDIYFGNSRTSVGIQLADICVYFIARHLAQSAESEVFYGIIKDQIFESEVFPIEGTILYEDWIKSR